MGRPLKIGLDYFFLDCDYESDTAIRRLVVRCGAIAKLAYIETCLHAYRDYGYYLPLADAELEIIAGDCGLKIDEYQTILTNMLEVGLFVKKQSRGVVVITSNRMQKNYESVRGNKGKISPEFSLNALVHEQGAKNDEIRVNSAGTPVTATKTPVNSAETPANATKSAQSRVEKSKEYKTYAQNEFARFWEIYPKKVGKKPAMKAWGKLKLDADLITAILAAVENQKKSETWREPRFIPYPATWLNGERWEDEIITAEAAEPPWQSATLTRDFAEHSAGEVLEIQMVKEDFCRVRLSADEICSTVFSRYFGGDGDV